MMKKFFQTIFILSFLHQTLIAGEIQFGSGTLSLTGGFVGLTHTIDTDITSYTLKEQHRNFGDSKYYFNYTITWYDSKDLNQAVSTINSYVQQTQGFLNQVQQIQQITLPSFTHKIEGFDCNFVLGRDFIHDDENNFLGIGILVGATFPWIESTNDDNNDDSETDILTFKVGPSIAGRFSFNKYLMIYANGSFAYQYGSIKNDNYDTDLSVDGIFYQIDAGIRFQPFSAHYEVSSWLSISPKLYFTLGYRYNNWDVKDIAIDLSGYNLSYQTSNLTFDSSVTYFGIGYDLF